MNVVGVTERTEILTWSEKQNLGYCIICTGREYLGV